jgi:hypothetical protein
MLIRKEQIDAIVSQRRDESERSFIAYFRDTIPDSVRQYDDEALRRIIGDGIERASRYGIAGGSSLVQFLALSLTIAPTFDDEPATHRFLCMPGLNSDVKLELLTNLICQRLRNLP